MSGAIEVAGKASDHIEELIADMLAGDFMDNEVSLGMLLCEKHNIQVQLKVTMNSCDFLDDDGLEELDEECFEALIADMQESLKSKAPSIHVNHIDNGWYEFAPHQECAISWLDMDQIVQVIEGKVWATGIREETTVQTAAKQGAFVRKIQRNQ